jgi:hypothetical protein
MLPLQPVPSRLAQLAGQTNLDSDIQPWRAVKLTPAFPLHKFVSHISVKHYRIMGIAFINLVVLAAVLHSCESHLSLCAQPHALYVFLI